jgi:hypothetical protein
MPSNLCGLESENRRVFAGVTARRRTTILLLFAVLFPAIVSFGILYRQALSVPYQDDYNAILAFAVDYDQLPTLKTKVLEVAAAQHNEYKLSFEHFIVASEIELTHHLNFKFLITLGDFFLLPIGYLVWRIYSGSTSDLNCRLLEFLPISLLLFSLTYWENLNWAMTGLQNTPVIFFSLLAIYLLAPDRESSLTNTRLLLACLAAALAAFSSANGFFLGPVGLAILLPRRAYAKSFVWCASFIVPLAAYLYHYTSSVHVMSRVYYLTRPLFFLAFLGDTILFRWVAALLGIVIVAILSLAVRSRFDRINPAAFYSSVWIVATACIVAWVRGESGFVIASRYSMYSILLLIFCYSFLAWYLPKHSTNFNLRRFYIASAVVTGGIFLIANVNAYKKLGVRRRMVLSGIEYYRANPEVNSPMVDPEMERDFPKEKAFEQVILTKVIQKGIYNLPPEQKIH